MEHIERIIIIIDGRHDMIMQRMFQFLDLVRFQPGLDEMATLFS